jgi:5'-phosphate synthase pdxT subunit
MERGQVKIGVLAVQGNFAAHKRMLERVGVESVEVRRASQLDSLDGLIIPGGESTTMLKFLVEENLAEPIRDFASSGRAIFGTCAGAILLAHEVTGPAQPSLGLIDISVERNAYGRQIDSFVGKAETDIDGGALEAVFIRAPRITRVGPGVAELAHIDAEPVLVLEGKILVATFHPEMTTDERVHRLFVGIAGEPHHHNVLESRNGILQMGRD